MKSTTLKTKTMALMASLAMVTSACAQRNTSFGLLSDEARFTQNSSATNGKMDILFVVDNSGSMLSSQQAMTAEFREFIALFNSKGFDYRLAVIATDAYRAQFGANATRYTKFKDGTDATSHTGVFVIDPSTPNLEQTFVTNAMQGASGSGDERMFQSIPVALDHAVNAPFTFPRPDAFLAIIMLSDEDDFSHDGTGYIDGQYSNPALHTVDRYVQYLDAKTGATADNRSTKYNVSSIQILDQACADQLNSQTPGRRIGIRLAELADKTNGVKGSLCGDFAASMAAISNKIIELATQFYLDRTPNPETFDVRINGISVPKLTPTSPAPWDGFMYHANTNSITFHGAHIPPQGSVITVKFDPTGLK